MNKPIVYIETTIPSFYHDIRLSPEIVARRKWTRQWWDVAREGYQPVTSFAVIEELNAGPASFAANWLDLVRGIPRLPFSPEIEGIVRTYHEHKLMPADPGGDALHLAMASFHACDFLLTWNCAHLANANKFGHIRRLNSSLGLFIPTIVTPLELLGGGDGTEAG